MKLFASLKPDQPVFEPLEERARTAEALLSSVSRIIGGRNELEVVKSVSDVLVQMSPHIQLVWTWFGETNVQTIKPQVVAGKASSYANQLVIKRSRLTQLGPVFRILDGKPSESFTVSQWSLFAPWRQAAVQHGIRSVLAIPLTSTEPGHSGIFVVYADHEDYFNLVGEGLFLALGAMFSSVLSVTAERASLEKTAYHDALTATLNRHAVPSVERRLARRFFSDPPAAVMLLDLDRFKLINDIHGHAVGDEVLKAVASVLRSSLRREDEIMRWGGEEFLVCLPKTELAHAMQIAEKLRRAVEAMNNSLKVTVSIGVSELPPNGMLLDAVAQADKGLYKAKAQGRNRVVQQDG